MLTMQPNGESAAPMLALKIVSWNVETLARYLEPLQPLEPLEPIPQRDPRRAPPRLTRARAWPSLAEVAARLGGPDVLCLQEVRIRPQDSAAIANARAALPGYDCRLSLNTDTENARFRGGRAHGVATYLRGNVRARHCQLPWDREGRVLVTKLDAQRLAIVNVYAVNGTSKPYFDHELGRIDGDRHDFKRRFNRLLMEACAELQSDGFRLLLIGDWNISRSAIDTFPRLRTEAPHALARSLFNEEFIPALNVSDVFRHLHPEARRYTWFNRSAARSQRLDAARVDFALLSTELLPAVVSAGIHDDQAMSLGSDHAPLWVELLLGS
jgi:exodeoxyribonuclease III